jgi:hypothetical protein
MVGLVSADYISAFASVGTLLVIVATAVAAFIQLRHMRVTNGVMVLAAFREEYERLQESTSEELPIVLDRLSNPDVRRELSEPGSRPWLRPVFPMMRLMETLGNYTSRNIVPPDLVCDQWAPVISTWWHDYAPLIAVLRRTNGPSMFEHWEAIAVMSKRWLDEERQTYPKHLPRIGLVDPWAAEDAPPPGA